MEMTAQQIRSGLKSLPDVELLQAGRITDQPGVNEFYSGRTVVILLAKEREADAAELRRLHAEIERLRTLLAEAGTLFRVYEQSHRAKGPGHDGKVERNAEIAGRIEAALTPNF
jgi:hypothetical protein